MEIVGSVFDTLFFGPIVNLLILIYKLVIMAGLPGAIGIATIVLSIAIRFLIWPFTAAQFKSTKKLTSLKPMVDELKLKHKDNKPAFQKAQMELYKEHGVNPVSGCLPTLIQLPIFIALYQAIMEVFPVADRAAAGLERINSVLYSSWLHLSMSPDPNFLGFSLISKPSDFMTYGYWLLLVPLLTAALAFVQAKMTLPEKLPKVTPSDSPKEKKEKEGIEDMMGGVQTQMVYLMPLMVGYFAFTFPVGLAIYWNTFTIMGIFQQHRIAGWGGMTDLLVRIRNLKLKISN